MPKRHNQLRVKDLSKVPTWQPVEPAILRTKGAESTNEPPRPTQYNYVRYSTVVFHIALTPKLRSAPPI